MTFPRKASVPAGARGGVTRHRGPRQNRARLALIAAALTASVVAAATASAQASAPAAAQPTNLYLVQTAGNPLASYTGGVAGLAATRPADGEGLDVTSPAARAYRDHLTKQYSTVLSRAGVATGKKTQDYGVTFNGFAAKLTAAEASRLKSTPGVLRVWPNEILKADTTTTPTFLGLTGQTGVWQKQFGGVQHAGEGIIVGVVDSGIWAEDPSFAALPEPRPDRKTIAKKWHGTCDAGTEQPIACNNKLIGARWYNAAANVLDQEFLSPRDFNGHGSHTASTAAGNYNVPASINGGSVGNISGMAPQARIAAYKVLWDQGDGTASGGSADIVAAIDQAVADGVDVINFSISGSRTFVVDPTEVAFFNAAAAGVFVATSAGNNGDSIGVSSVAHNSPWLTTVAASTHDRGSNKTVTLGNGATYNGVGVGPAIGPKPVVLSTDAVLAGADPTAARLCFSSPPSLDPAKVTGKIVVCDRGSNARVDKSLAVANAGGVGMILANTAAGQSLNADFHTVPSIHVDSVAGAAVKAYVTGSAGATATISAQSTDPVRAPEMGSFSSFGPALAGGGDLLKPDITAPGVDVIAAVAPPGNGGNTFNSFSGTSMASPHIAGIAALIKGKNPKWSPMWIKSAMMTTASQLDNTGQPIQRSGHNATPLDFGSGHVVPAKAFDPGLVYDSTPTDWIQYGCGIGQFQLITDPSFCASAGSIDPSDLNYPSISVGDLAGTQTIKRTVTNTVDKYSIYYADVTAPAGFSVTVNPPAIFLPPFKKATFTVTITRTTAPLGQWAFGSLTWADGNRTGAKHSVRSPIAVRPVALAAPAEVSFSGTSGSGSLSLRSGYTGTLGASVVGLTADTVTDLSLDLSGPAFNSNAPAASAKTGLVTVTVPAGTSFARFATTDADYAAGTDLDMFVYLVNGTTRTLVGQSAGGTAEESVTLTAPGTYEIYVDLFALPGGATSLTAKHHHWVVPNAAAGNLTASPASQAVTTGSPASVSASWSGLTAGVWYLGAVNFTDGTNPIGQTILSVTG